MESVIGSKKYFKSLGPTESDYYHRHKTGFLPTNYSSNYNTLGRCSTGPYVHLNNFPALHVDVGGGGGGMAAANQYRYNSWGMLNDGGSRKLAPSISYSSAGDSQKTRVKSFTILLMTAAFIVMLAVLSVAGLAFYFSTFKSELSEPLMAFDGEFMVVRGDVFTTGLKYNHTTAFEQKSHIYEQMIRKAVVASGLVVLRCEVLGFGEGPLVNVIFRIHLDIRKIPAAISSIEDHIIESIVKEFAAPSNVNSIKIDRHSVQVKRIINNDQFSLASMMGLSQSTTFDSKPPSADLKHSTEPAAAKQSHHALNAGRSEPVADQEHVPGVLHGSFEVTKTDADITQKKSSSPLFPATSTSTLRPFNVTNVGSSIKVKTKKITIEKVTLPTKATMPIPEQTSSETVPSARTTVRTTPTTTTAAKPLPTEAPTTTTTSTTTERPTTTTSTTTTPTTTVVHKATNVQPNNLPQLNEQLFTRAPILDNKPWLPIDPTVSVMQTNTDAVAHTAFSHRLTTGTGDFESTTTDAPPSRVYHSFSNPAFDTAFQSIEPLGSNAVRRYPIPVDKINMKNTPHRQQSNNVPNTLHVSNGNYEHLGGGIMVKKSEEKKKETTTDQPKPTTTLEQLTSLPIVNQPKVIESVAVNSTSSKQVLPMPVLIADTPVLSTKPTPPNSTYVRIDTINPSVLSTPAENTTSWDQPLFPMNLKPGAIQSRNKTPIRKTYNDTLQAWIVENDQTSKPNTLRHIGSTATSKSNIQNISVIFDTLASKLGITPNVSGKEPTLFTSAQHKSNTKQTANRTQLVSSTTTTTTVVPSTSSSTQATPPSSLPTEAVYGEAEIEEVDPTQYEEILQNDRIRARYEATTSLPVTLITLMPVKSNSGLRLPMLLDSGSAEEARDFDEIIQ